MKYYIIPLIFNLFFLSISNSQITEKDSVNIAFKAKLLTTSRFGLADTSTIKKSIQKQDLEFISNPTNSIILLKIKFDQKYYMNNKNRANFFYGKCYYYLSYNTKTNKFYRLGGFDSLDIKDFFNDLNYIEKQEKEKLFLKGFDSDYDGIDIICLSNYNDLSKKKKRKKGFKCFNICSKSLNLDGDDEPHPLDN